MIRGVEDQLAALRQENAELRDELRAQRETEQALHESEERLHLVMDHSADGIWAIDAEGRTTFGNQRMAEILGATLEELLDSTMYDFAEEEAQLRAESNLERRSRGVTERHDFTFVRRDGSLVVTSMSSSPVYAPDGSFTGALAIVRDVSEERRAVQALRDSEERLRLALSAARMGTWEWLVHEDKVTWSRELDEVLGARLDETESGYELFVQLIHPDDRDRVHKTVEEALKRPEGDEFAFEYRIVRPDGEMRWVHSQGRVLDDEQGRHGRMVGTLMDVSLLRRLEADLLQAQRMESIGRLAGGVAHDFNNLLTVILSSAELAQRKVDPDSGPGRHLEQIERAAGRAGELTRQLLSFARKQVIQLQIVDVNALVADVEQLLGRLLGEQVELVCATTEQPLPVKADRGQLEQVLINLAVNARDAMPDRGTLCIEAAPLALDGKQAAAPGGLPPGDYVRITVTDTGVGMDKETLAHVFEPFFTTKELGTGLGLASAYGLIKQLSGDISASSTLGKGTRFEIYLPRLEESASAPSARTTPLTRRGVETVLVVEDEPLVQRTVVGGLGSRGYTVLAASGAKEALELASARKENIDALITDVILPDQNGRQLAHAFREYHPESSILFVSGYPDAALDSAELSRASFLQKPFTIDALTAALRKLLEER